MAWFLARDDRELQLETRYNNDTREYVLVIHGPGTAIQGGTFRDAADSRGQLA
jgi:hypothetical protein